MKKIFSVSLFVLAIYSTNAFSSSVFSASSEEIKMGTKITNKYVFNGFGCSGKNISPEISWKNAPEGTKSFAITVYDPDAPTGSGWWHYLAVNIPVNYNSLPSNFGKKNSFKTTDNILQIRNDFGIRNFGGPCPPQGDKPHRYIWTIHALSVEKLEISEDATAALAGFMINANSIAKANLEAFYSR
ncbi:MAG: YbhB/YbcL family Raf kinase inhibitor-like protein [Pelagibacterales bacterium]|nr:YbhB/YbcL family Raf kinase inhibitor-like protein [Pelagibacterales bacterium]